MQKEAEQLISLAGTGKFKTAMNAFHKKYGDSPEVQKLLSELIHKSVAQTDKKLDNIEKEINLKKQLKEVSEIVSMAYIAEKYFGKTKQWLYARINGNLVNGKPGSLKHEEVKILNSALKDIGKKISSTKVSLS